MASQGARQQTQVLYVTFVREEIVTDKSRLTLEWPVSPIDLDKRCELDYRILRSRRKRVIHQFGLLRVLHLSTMSSIRLLATHERFERLTADGTRVVLTGRDPLLYVFDYLGRGSGCFLIREGELSGDSVLSILGSVLEDDGEFFVQESGLPDEGRSGRDAEDFEENE